VNEKSAAALYNGECTLATKSIRLFYAEKMEVCKSATGIPSVVKIMRRHIVVPSVEGCTRTTSMV
jgi:hypothetical protein